MRAIRFDEYGDPDVLHLAEVPEPEPGPGEIRIEVRAAAVNPWDWKLRSGASQDMVRLDLPAGTGIEASGVVDRVGPDVDGVAVGDRVLGSGSDTLAELAVLGHWAPLPDALGFEQGAALPSAAETSARVLDLLDLSPGDLVVVDGAAGGVGTVLVQLAVARGLAVVATASEANQDYLRDLDATPTTYGEGLADRVRALVDSPVAGAVDLQGKGAVPELVELTGDPSKVVTIADFGAGERGVQVTAGPSAFYAYAEVAALAAAGRLRVEIARTLPLAQAAEAHRLSEAGHARGKIVLTVG